MHCKASSKREGHGGWSGGFYFFGNYEWMVGEGMKGALCGVYE